MNRKSLKKYSTLTFFFFLFINLSAQEINPIKNIIFMVPDGTSTSVLSLSRWYKSGLGYADNQQIDKVSLHLDPYICGLVKTHSSDAPIGDSAPTGSTFATGVVSQAGYVATYPEKTTNDIIAVDPALANTPAMTILECAKLLGKSTGLAVTCEFPHATPADFSAHTSSRGEYNVIIPQMVKNNIDVVLGGGIDLLNEEGKNYLLSNGWSVILGDYDKFKNFSGSKVWGLFSPRELPYAIDKGVSKIPTLAEMTATAINTLSKNEKGFFLMVEGSKVDWAAHGNDPATIITEFLDFDEAAKVAFDFAEKDGNTLVIICPDHGNSAISMGSALSNSGYSKLPKNKIMEPLVKCKVSQEQFSKILSEKNNTKESLEQDFAHYLGIEDLNEEDFNLLADALQINSKTNRVEQNKVKNAIRNIFSKKIHIGFTTTGHTGEDVFLAMYHPQGNTLKGVVHNTHINEYMQQAFGVTLADSTKKYFCGHKTLFPEKDYSCILDDKSEIPTLSITSKKTKKVLFLKAFDNQAVLNKKTMVPSNTVFVYSSKNNEFYIPRSLKDVIDEK